jgi:hypothetical protein
MLGVLQMTNWATSHTLVTLSLNGIDVFFAFFLVLGGWNLTVAHPMAGYACVLTGALLLYLSSSLWNKRKIQMVTRLVLYWGSSICIGASLLVIAVARRLALPVDIWIAFVVVIVLLVGAVLSTVHLRQAKQTPDAEP